MKIAKGAGSRMLNAGSLRRVEVPLCGTENWQFPATKEVVGRGHPPWGKKEGFQQDPPYGQIAAGRGAAARHRKLAVSGYEGGGGKGPPPWGKKERFQQDPPYRQLAAGRGAAARHRKLAVSGYEGGGWKGPPPWGKKKIPARSSMQVDCGG